MYKLYGALASPYSQKMRAILRYRRITHVWAQGAEAQEATTHVKAPVIPVLEFPDGTHANDSTPLIYTLEQRHKKRSIVPNNATHAFLAHLIEDFADEWLTKAMFGYRWLDPSDQQQLSEWLAFDALKGGGLEHLSDYAQAFRERQTGRMPLVGCTQENFALISASAQRILDALEAHVVTEHYLFGNRPSLAEFGLFGQLSQLAVDPTPQAMMRARYPYTYRWLQHIDDASGIEGSWHSDVTVVRPVVEALLSEIGRVYGPFLIANEAATNAGKETFRIEIDDLTYEQGTFRYQVKCLADLRARFEALSPENKAALEPILSSTRCLKFLKQRA